MSAVRYGSDGTNVPLLVNMPSHRVHENRGACAPARGWAEESAQLICAVSCAAAVAAPTSVAMSSERVSHLLKARDRECPRHKKKTGLLDVLTQPVSRFAPLGAWASRTTSRPGVHST